MVKTRQMTLNGRVNCPTSRSRREGAAESAHWAVNESNMPTLEVLCREAPILENLETFKRIYYTVNKMNMNMLLGGETKLPHSGGGVD